MTSEERNLFSLKAEYHDKGKAMRGLKTITTFIKNEDAKGLAHLLRFHSPEGVYGKELIQRFEIDALLEFYNLLIVAVAAGVVPPGLNSDLREEIITVLNHKSVIPYYTKHYQYKMLSFTLQYVQEKSYTQNKSISDAAIFYGFLSLNRSLKEDEDLERFMGVLDYVWYENANLDDVNKILSSLKKLEKTLTKKKRNEADKGVWGFIKYTTFLSQLAMLLRQATDNSFLQAAMWHYHGYYLDRMNQKMILIFDTAFKNIQLAISDERNFKSIINEIYADTENTTNLIETLKYVNEEIKKSMEDVKFVLSRKFVLNNS